MYLHSLYSLRGKFFAFSYNRMLGSIPSTLPQPLSSSGLAQKHKEKHKDDRILKSTNKNKFVQPKETGNNDKPKENALKLPLMSSNSKRPTPKERLKPHSKSNKKAKDISSLQKSTEHTSETKSFIKLFHCKSLCRLTLRYLARFSVQF